MSLTWCIFVLEYQCIAACDCTLIEDRQEPNGDLKA